MISSRKELKEYLEYEKNIYIPKEFGKKLEYILVKEKRLVIWRYIKLLRKTEYWYNKNKNLFRNFMYVYYRRKKNIMGNKLGIEIWENSFDKGLNIWHSGNIVVNGNAKIGKNCLIHGGVCIGKNGKDDESPIIGDNADIGFNSIIIGNVKIGNNIKIGASAVVNRNFEEDNITLIGIPAKRKEKNEQ